MTLDCSFLCHVRKLLLQPRVISVHSYYLTSLKPLFLQIRRFQILCFQNTNQIHLSFLISEKLLQVGIKIVWKRLGFSAHLICIGSAVYFLLLTFCAQFSCFPMNQFTSTIYLFAICFSSQYAMLLHVTRMLILILF